MKKMRFKRFSIFFYCLFSDINSYWEVMFLLGIKGILVLGIRVMVVVFKRIKNFNLI